MRALAVFLLTVAALAVFLLFGVSRRGAPRAPAAATVAAAPERPAAPAPRPVAGCPPAPEPYNAPAQANAASLYALEWSPWGVAERGWEIYAPAIAHEIGTTCPPQSAGFAWALGAWQEHHDLVADGAMTPETFEAMRVIWHKRRPFVAAAAEGQCPPAPDEAGLETLRPEEAYGGQPVRLRPGAAGALRRMRADFRAETPGADPRLLTVFSGYRSPTVEAERCADGGCGGPARANCSAHRTGLAADLYVGAPAGGRPDSTDDATRLHLSRTAAYRWLVANGPRYGFTPYPYEPWHWEWTGETP